MILHRVWLHALAVWVDITRLAKATVFVIILCRRTTAEIASSLRNLAYELIRISDFCIHVCVYFRKYVRTCVLYIYVYAFADVCADACLTATGILPCNRWMPRNLARGDGSESVELCLLALEFGFLSLGCHNMDRIGFPFLW